MNRPYIFDEFFASGKEEAISPFLTPASRIWGRHLPLRSAICSAAFLFIAWLSALFFPAGTAIALFPVYFLSGTPALIASIEDLCRWEINIDVLMTLAAMLSVLIGSPLEGALLLVLFEFSAAMEASVEQRAKGAVATLHELSPRTVSYINPQGEIIETSIHDIQTGDRLLVKAGEVVPLDGNIIEGHAYVHLKHLTGESAPVAKHPGDTVHAGALNVDGVLIIDVARTSADSTLARLIQLITKAQEQKPRAQKLFDRFGKGYAILVIGLAACFAVTLPLYTSLPYLGDEGAIYRALTFLIAASPCALIIAVPIAYLSALSSCAKTGILLKGSILLDSLTQCSTIAFDKTGTLTTGELRCTGIRLLATADAEVLSQETGIAVAATLEQNTTHPIGRALCRYAQEHALLPWSITTFRAHSGLGLEGTVHRDGKVIVAYIGHPDFIRQRLPPTLELHWEKLRDFLIHERPLGALLLANETLFFFDCIDAVRPEAKTAIAQLHKRPQLDLVMLTGDHEKNAAQVGHYLGIEKIYANLRPEDKLAQVASLATERGLIMVGDGINDAPALARATVGISMGQIGSATAIDASDIVFIRDDLTLVDWLLSKSMQTRRIVIQNISLALAVIAFTTTPALLGIVPLWLAVLLHEGGTVLVGINSLRLLRTSPPISTLIHHEVR